MMKSMVSNGFDWGRGWKSAAAVVLTVGAACLSTPTWAASATDLTITLTATPADAVSVSRKSLSAYMAYRVTLTNSGTNTINQVRLTGATTADGTTPASYNSVVTNDPAFIAPVCAATPGVGPSSVSCTLGQMKSGAQSDFFLIFQTPTDGLSLHFILSTTFSEGGSPTSPPANVIGRTLSDDVTLTTETNSDVNAHVKTVLPPGGGNFFTGPEGAVSSANPFSTIVTLPGVANLVTINAIDLSLNGTFPCGQTIGYSCFGLQSSINVDNAKDNSKVFYDQVAPGNIITIVLRQDVSTLGAKPYPKVGDVQIFYNPNTPVIPADVGSLVPACATGLPAANQPCVSQRFDKTKGNKGFYEYWIQAVDNGNFSW